MPGTESEAAATGARDSSLPARSKLAVTAGRMAAAASRSVGRGSGSVIGGKVALKLDPDLLARLADHLDVVLVSATNGKTTTTRLIAEALRAAARWSPTPWAPTCRPGSPPPWPAARTPGTA